MKQNTSMNQEPLGNIASTYLPSIPDPGNYEFTEFISRNILIFTYHA